MDTKDILKIILPEDSFKDELLQKFEYLSKDQQFHIAQIAWDMYDALFEYKLQENISLALQHAGEGTEKLNQDLFDRVSDLTEQELHSGELEKISEVDLLTARKALEDILKQKKKDSEVN